jgi:hypothetical protein
LPDSTSRVVIANGLYVRYRGYFGQHILYPVSDWSSLLLRTIMDISALATSLADRPRMGRSGHQCSHAPGRPILHLVSSSRRPRQAKALVQVIGLLRILECSFVRAPTAVPSSRPARLDAPRKGAVKAGRHAGCAARSAVARPRLDGPEHGARIKWVGPTAHRFWRTRRPALCGEPPMLCERACWRVRSPARCGAVASWLFRSMI